MERLIFHSSRRRVKIKEIDFSDKRFFFRYKLLFSSLSKSIKRMGVLSPPRLREKEGGYQIISGFRRLFAAYPFFEKIDCVIYPSMLPDSECVRILLAEHESGLSPLDYAGLVHLAASILGEREAASLLCIEERRVMMLQALFKSPFLCKLLWKGRINLERAFFLLKLEEDVAKGIFSLYNLGSSPSLSQLKRLSELLAELKRIFHSLDKVFHHSFVDEALKEDGKKRVDALLEALFKLRYPLFSAYKKKVQEQIKSMKEVKVCIDPFLEEGRLKIEFEAQSCKDIKKALDACRRYMEEGKFDALFKLLCAKEEG